MDLGAIFDLGQIRDIFPSPHAGDYAGWRDATTPAGAVTIRGGEVTTFQLD